jgi:catechol 2,3-dioxygenase-like lactoylglutathione lyase family enzyme
MLDKRFCADDWLPLPFLRLEPLMPVHVLRVARPTNDVARAAGFYIQGLGFEVLAQFVDHQGFDGIVLGHREYPWHIELTHQHNVTVPNAPTKEHLLVIYLPMPEEWETAVERFRALGNEPVPAENPYWDRQGLTFEDPDGYRVVLQNTSWTR